MCKPLHYGNIFYYLSILFLSNPVSHLSMQRKNQANGMTWYQYQLHTADHLLEIFTLGQVIHSHGSDS